MVREIWPNFFIVGTQRAGTTSLYEYLRQVPQIYMSPVKEPYYFAPNFPSNPFIRAIRERTEYLDLFQGVKKEIAIGEASPLYLWDVKSPSLISSAAPDARIIIILRNPVERAFSAYLMCVHWGYEKRPFLDALMADHDHAKKNGYHRFPLYAELGFYSEQVKRYLDTFGMERVKILFFEEFVQTPKEATEEIVKFLGIETKLRNNVGKIYKSSSIRRRFEFTAGITRLAAYYRTYGIIDKIFLKVPTAFKEIMKEKILFEKATKPDMPIDARIYLQKLYSEDIHKLRNIIGRPLSWASGGE